MNVSASMKCPRFGSRTRPRGNTPGGSDAHPHIEHQGRVMSANKRIRRGMMFLAPAVALATAVAGCSNSSTTGGSTGAVPSLTGDCAAYQQYAGHAGTKVTMFASIVSPESDSLQK